MAEVDARVVEELRDTLSPEEQRAASPDLIYMFARAHKDDIEKASNALRASLEWRKQFEIDTILDESRPAKLELGLRYWGGIVHKTDHEGRPMVFERLSNLLKTDFCKQFTIQEWGLIFAYVMEMTRKQMREQSKKLDKPITDYVFISDMADSSLLESRRYMAYSKYQYALTEAHYPALVHKVLVVNTSSVFPMLLRMFSPFLPKDTKEKMEVYSSGNSTKSAIGKLSDASSLPAAYGGTCQGACLPTKSPRTSLTCSCESEKACTCDNNDDKSPSAKRDSKLECFSAPYELPPYARELSHAEAADAEWNEITLDLNCMSNVTTLTCGPDGGVFTWYWWSPKIVEFSALWTASPDADTEQKESASSSGSGSRWLHYPDQTSTSPSAGCTPAVSGQFWAREAGTLRLTSEICFEAKKLEDARNSWWGSSAAKTVRVCFKLRPFTDAEKEFNAQEPLTPSDIMLRL